MNNDLTFKMFEVFKSLRKTLLSNNTVDNNFNYNDLVLSMYLLSNEEDNKLTQVKDFSEYMNISRPAVNTILNRLEDRGIIERFRLKDDRKSVYVKLTKGAYKLIDEEKEKIASFLNRIIDKLGEPDALMLINLLEKVNNILKEEVNNLC